MTAGPGASLGEHETAAAFADSLRASFGVAERSGVAVWDATLADRTVRFRYASPSLAAAFRPAFAHLLADVNDTVAEPSLTVDVWDSTSGAPAPVSFEPADHDGDDGWFFREGSLQVSLRPRRGTLSAFEATTRHAWWWIPDGALLPWFERAAPMRHLFHWWTSSEGLALVHAAAVGSDEGGALIIGKGGSGKSTLALATLGSGLRYCGDDMVILDPTGGWRAHSVWATAKLVAGGQQLVPRLRVDELMDGDDPAPKLLVDVFAQCAEAMAASVPVTAVVLPRVADQDRPPEPLRPALAALALGPSTFIDKPGGEPAAALGLIARMVEQVPAYRLDMGPEVAGAVRAVEALVRGEPG